MIDFVEYKNENKFPIDKNRIGILGHSREAANPSADGLIIASEENKKIKFLIMWASIASYDRWTQHQKSVWKKLGYLPLSKNINSSPLKINYEYLLDLQTNEKRFDLIESSKNIKIPWLIIHGVEDLVAKFSEAELLYNLSDKSETKLLKIEKVGYTFSVSLPFDENNKIMNNIIDMIINWLKSQNI